MGFRSKPAAVYAGSRPFFVSHAPRIAELSLKARLPLFATRRPFVDAGGLLIALPEADAAAMEARYPQTYRIGRVIERGTHAIRILS